MGETENIGNPTTDAEKAYGRSLPKRELPDFPIRGYEYYDYRHDVVNTTFRNYEDNATRKTGAISNLMFSSFGVSTNNAFERVKFVNAKPVYFPPMEGNRSGPAIMEAVRPIRPRRSSDKDGSLGAGPNSFVLIHDGVNDSIAVDTEACEIKPTWNAAVCKGDVGRMNVGGAGGGGRSRRLAVALEAQLLLLAHLVVEAQLLVLAHLVRRGCRSGRTWRSRRCCWSRRTRWRRRGAAAGRWRTWWSWRRCRCSSCSAASRSQPQWQGVHRNLGQRTSRYRDQGDHRKAERVPLRDGTGSAARG